jgi:hypothetical protein
MHHFPNPRPNRPEFAPPSLEARSVMGFAAFLISAALLGGLLGLFEQRSNEAAMARAVAPAGAASGALAVRGPWAAKRG